MKRSVESHRQGKRLHAQQVLRLTIPIAVATSILPSASLIGGSCSCDSNLTSAVIPGSGLEEKHLCAFPVSILGTEGLGTQVSHLPLACAHSIKNGGALLLREAVAQKQWEYDHSQIQSCAWTSLICRAILDIHLALPICCTLLAL